MTVRSPLLTLEESIVLRRVLHAMQLARLEFVRFASNRTFRIGADATGRVFMASYDELLGWGPWSRAHTNSFDRYVRNLFGCSR
jgi:hypothetical protein